MLLFPSQHKLSLCAIYQKKNSFSFSSALLPETCARRSAFDYDDDDDDDDVSASSSLYIFSFSLLFRTIFP